MNLQGSASLAEYKEAFQRLDEDGSGYIETSEIESLLSDVYGGDVPQFEIDSFLRFFDSNRDGRISWEEFEQGLGAMTQEQAAKAMVARFMLPQAAVEDDDDVSPEIDTEVTGKYTCAYAIGGFCLFSSLSNLLCLFVCVCGRCD